MADPFSVFTAGRVGEKAIEERQFQQKIGLQERGLGLQERGLDIQESLGQQNVALRGGELGATRASTERRGASETLKFLVDSHVELTSQLRGLPQEARVPLEKALQQSAAAGDQAINTITGGQAPLGTFQGLVDSAIRTRQEGLDSPSIVELQRARDAAVAEGRSADARQIESQIETFGASQTFDPRDPRAVGRLGPRELEALRGSLKSGFSDLAEVETVLNMVEDNPLAVGFFGGPIEFFGGLAQQLPGVDALVGGTPTKVSRVRTRIKALAGRLLPTITAEESGRFTDTERDIVTDIISGLKAARSNEQVTGNLEELISVMQESNNRNVEEFLGAGEVDISTPEGQDVLFSQLLGLGIAETEALDAILAALQRRGITL